MRLAPVATISVAAMIFAAGCGLSYQAASEYRTNKMERELKSGDTMAQVQKKFGEPDIEDRPDGRTEIWSYAKHANSNDVAAEILYTSAKEGDQGTFEDLKFTDGSLVSWGESQHTMPAKERSEITTTLSYGHPGGHSETGQSGPASSEPSDSSTPTGRANPFSVTF
jgi:lipopolysaccharide export LptBFGC system permease protein LptF